MPPLQFKQTAGHRGRGDPTGGGWGQEANTKRWWVNAGICSAAGTRLRARGGATRRLVAQGGSWRRQLGDSSLGRGVIPGATLKQRWGRGEVGLSCNSAAHGNSAAHNGGWSGARLVRSSSHGGSWVGFAAEEARSHPGRSRGGEAPARRDRSSLAEPRQRRHGWSRREVVSSQQTPNGSKGPSADSCRGPMATRRDAGESKRWRLSDLIPRWRRHSG